MGQRIKAVVVVNGAATIYEFLASSSSVQIHDDPGVRKRMNIKMVDGIHEGRPVLDALFAQGEAVIRYLD